MFETHLIDNLKEVLGLKAVKVYRRYGRIICDMKKIDDSLISVLEKIPGISYFAFAYKTKLDFEDIKKNVLELAGKEDFEKFKIETKRSDKSFPMNSFEINTKIGELVADKFSKKADMKNPDLRIHIEIVEKEAFVYSKKYSGVGGLPVGSAGKVVCSLSGGIDSPVAAFLLMKRGCRVVFVHIHNNTQADKGVLSKINELVKKLTQFQLDSKLYIVPFGNIQKTIIANVPSTVRMIVYRRFMLEIINRIAKKENAKSIITGDSVGQVASQTLENIGCIYDASEFPVFAPLIGMNKEEIIFLARKIDTFDCSIQPYPDCCSFMIAQHPETKACLEDIKTIEESINEKEELIKEAVKNAEIRRFCYE